MHPMTAGDFMREYELSTNTHSFDEVAKLIDDEAVFWFNSGSHHGIAAIRAAFERTWAMIQEETYAIQDLVCVALSETAAAYVYTFHWEGLIDGKPSRGRGRGTNVLVKRGEDWKVIHEHLSAFP